MTQGDTIRQARELARKAARARSRSQALRAETAEVARQIAETEQDIADTLDRLIPQHLQHGSRLRDEAKAARKQAARLRRWLDRHARPPPG